MELVEFYRQYFIMLIILISLKERKLLTHLRLLVFLEILLEEMLPSLVLLAVVNVEAFGWRLPLYIFPFEWLKLGLLALLVAGLSVLLPAIRLMRLAPADLLRIFADER